MAPFIRPFLVVSQTTLTDPTSGERYPFHGLFAGEDLALGAFLGFYNGIFKDGTYRGKGKYTFSTSDMYVRPRSTKNGISAVEYPLAMCNEPAPESTANVCNVEFTKADKVIPQLKSSAKIAAIGFYACRPIQAGEELFIHYGRFFNRSHYPRPEDQDIGMNLVGKQCYVKKMNRETPLQMMESCGLHPFVPNECYAEYEE